MKLAWQCNHGECENPRMGSLEYCASCAKSLRDIQKDLARPVKPVKGLKRTPVNKVSTKRAFENGRYSVERLAFLEKNPLCVACGDLATEVHHAAGRENHLLMEKQYWKAVCHGCHIAITEDSAWAIAQGYSLKRST